MRRFVRLLSLCLLFSFFGSAAAHAATLTVTSNADSGSGTLREAIANAGNGDTINFDASMTITLASTLTLAQNITIDGGNTVAVDGNGANTVLLVSPGVTAQISNLTIQNGNGKMSGGGGINNSGTLTLTNSRLSGNTCSNNGGGGLLNFGTAMLLNSILSGNSCNGGGGITSIGRLTLTNSTLSANSATDSGGGIYNIGSGTLTMTNSTLSGNSSPGDGGGIYNNGAMITMTNSTLSGNSSSVGGGGIFIGGGTVTLTNSTLAGNTSIGGGVNINFGNVQIINTIIADSCTGTSTDGGGNIDTGTSCGFANGVNGTQTGVTTAALNLGPLANNGGPTQTMMPGAGSAAIGSGIDSVCTSAPVNGVDQRGIPRPQGAHCDSGAVEVSVAAAAVAAPTFDRWAMLLLATLIGAGVIWRLRHLELR